VFAYVANDHAETVSAFHIDAATGALMPLAAATITTDKNPYAVANDTPFSPVQGVGERSSA